MAEGGMSCIKYLVFICNLLFAATGILILTVGAIVQTKYHHYSKFVGETIWTAPVIFIVVGVIVFVVGFMGCCGAVKENSCMILTFSILIILIFLLEVGAAIAGYVRHGEIRGILEKGFNTSMTEYKEREDYRDAWKLLQGELGCCGAKSPDDWQYVFHNATLPPSCCAVIPQAPTQACTKDHSYQEGCMNKLFNILDSKSLVLGGVGIAVALLQILTILYACCLFRSFRQNYETV